MRTVTLTPSESGLRDLIPANELQSIVEFSAAHWNEALARCCAIRLEVVPAGRRLLAEEDGMNLVVLRRQSWCHNERCGNTTTYPSGTLAMTTRYPEGASGTQLREADVEVDARQVHVVPASSLTMPLGEQVHRTRSGIWVLSRNAGKVNVPLETVLVHELGHVLGLDDACVAGHRASGKPVIGDCTTEQRDRVMHARARKLHPSQMDLADVAKYYPLPHPKLDYGLLGILLGCSVLVSAIALLCHRCFR